MLKVLPEHIYSLIAAGEVIQRPASVVKELMENSADAGATSIMLVVSDYGRTLIQVIDNGCGMDAQEAGLCFLSHATSKIDAVEDLQNLSTFGFRGEALASIAACADVTLKTRKKGQQTGTQVHISGGKTLETTEIACPEGCNIAVRNLFFNIPARRKFLKSDNSEYRMIVSEFTRVALTRLDIEFRLISNSKEVITLPKGRNLKQRITDLYGSTIGKQLVDVSVDTTVVKLSGITGTPQSAKKTQQNTFLFANGRFFRSPMLHKAVLKAYGNLIPEGSTPHYFIFLEVPPQEMDVNISPSKTEIKLENEQVIFQIVEAAVKEAIGKNAFAPAIDFDTEGVPIEISTGDGFTLTPEEKKKMQQGGFRQPKIDYNPLFNPFEEDRKEKASGYKTVPSSINQQLMEAADQRRILQIDKNIVIMADGDGGILAALWDLSVEAKTGFEADLRKIPLRQEVIEVCELVDANPYRLHAKGCILFTARNGEAAKKALEDEGIPCTVIGWMDRTKGRKLHSGEILTYLDFPAKDELGRITLLQENPAADIE